MKFLGMSIVLMLESVKILYNFSVELSKYADRINGCSGILKFGVNPDQEISSQASVFAVSVICPVCQWRRSLSGGGYVSAICQIFRNVFLPIVGYF